MSTHANIAIITKDGSVIENYVHFDGYPEYALKILQKDYSDYESAYNLCNHEHYWSFVPPKELLNSEYLEYKTFEKTDKRLHFESIEDYNRFYERWALLHPCMYIYMNGKWIKYKVYRTGHE